ncbi:hypothetical protein D3C72_1019640 [compost metagenome]
MAGLVQALAAGIQRRRRQHADRTGQHGGFVRQDVAEQVAGHDDIELARVAHQLHGGVVDIHVRQLHVRILARHFNDDVAPELGRLQHIGLVHAAQLLVALAGRFEADARNAAHFGFGVAHGVVAFAFAREHAIGRRTNAARRAEIDVACQFADDQDVQAGHDLGLQRRGAGQLGIQDGGTQVGEQAQRLAQAQNGLLRAEFARQAVVLPVAHGAKQHGIRFLGQVQRGRRQRVFELVERGAAHGGLFDVEGNVQRLEHAHGLLDDFRSNAVTRQDCDVVGHLNAIL